MVFDILVAAALCGGSIHCYDVVRSVLKIKNIDFVDTFIKTSYVTIYSSAGVGCLFLALVILVS